MVSSVFMTAGLSVSGHRELTPASATIPPGKERADEPFPVVGGDVRSGSGDRRADSSRGRDNDALATDLHNHHRTRDAAGLDNHLSSRTTPPP
jgi:hypothetical protein